MYYRHFYYMSESTEPALQNEESKESRSYTSKEDAEYFKDHVSVSPIVTGIEVVAFTQFTEGCKRPSRAVKKTRKNAEEVNYLLQAYRLSGFAIKVYYPCNNQVVDYFLMKYCIGGSLRILLDKLSHKKLGRIYILNSFRNLAKTIKLLHENNIYHRDIKPENILIGKKNIMKLTDFDVAREIMPDQAISFKGTKRYIPYYFDEEIKDNKNPEYTKLIDVYGFGKTFLEAILWEKNGDKYIVLNKDHFSDVKRWIENDLHSVQLGKYQEFILSMLEFRGNTMTFDIIIENLSTWINDELQNPQENGFICYICGESTLYDDILFVSPHCTSHGTHASCYTKYLKCCRVQNPQFCLLCGHPSF
jgi:serine/threonine protein kinase